MRSKRAPAPVPETAVTPAAPVTPPVGDARERPGPYVLGRLLVVVAAVLLLSRPMIRGEAPGLTSTFADPSGLVWVFLALLGCVAWSLWRPWAGDEEVAFGPVELTLLIVALWHFVAASGAAVRHPAWVAAWQWFGLAMAALFVRQVARTEADRRGLVAALLATGLALAAEGVFQTLRPLWSAMPTEEDIRKEVLAQAYAPAPWEWAELLRPFRARGPYFSTAGLAAALVLLLPGLAAAWLASRRGGGPRWHQIALGGAALLVAAAALLTREWLMLFAAGSAWALVLGLRPADPRARVMGVLTLALGLAGTWWGLVVAGVMEPFAEQIHHVWPAGWKLAQANFWFGLGPEQFAYYYPRVMDEAAGARVRQPGSAPLQVLAELGVVGLVGLLAVAVLFTRAVLRWGRHAGDRPAEETATSEPGWELYLGGMVGLCIVFIVRAIGLPPDEVLQEALAAGVRAVAWFAGMALLGPLRWPPRLLVGGLAAGALGLAAALLVGPGIDAPSVVGPLLLCLVLVLAVVAPTPLGWLGRLRPLTALMPAVLIALAFGFFAFVFYPVANSLSAVHRARTAQVLLSDSELSGLRPTRMIRDRVIEPLERAHHEDPDNLQVLVLLSGWYGQLWQLNPYAEDQSQSSHRAVQYAARAQKVAPEAWSGYAAEVNRRREFAAFHLALSRGREDDAKKKKLTGEALKGARALAARHQDAAREQRRLAAAVLSEYVRRDPTDPELRYQLAELYFDSGDRERGRAQAREALRLDDRVGAPRSLSKQQRDKLESRLAP